MFWGRISFSSPARAAPKKVSADAVIMIIRRMVMICSLPLNSPGLVGRSARIGEPTVIERRGSGAPHVPDRGHRLVALGEALLDLLRVGERGGNDEVEDLAVGVGDQREVEGVALCLCDVANPRFV